MKRALLLLLLVPAVACASASAKTNPADRPALAVPPPPPRVIEPAPQPDPVPEPVPDLPPAPVTKPSRPPREAGPRQEPAKPPETKSGEVTPTEPPAPGPTAPQAPPQLRTPQTADSSEAEKNVRSTIERANKLLGGVNYQPLNNERKKAYNDAKLFIQQAEEASKQGNFVYAQGVATKAETLARELAGK